MDSDDDSNTCYDIKYDDGDTIEKLGEGFIQQFNVGDKVKSYFYDEANNKFITNFYVGEVKEVSAVGINCPIEYHILFSDKTSCWIGSKYMLKAAAHRGRIYTSNPYSKEYTSNERKRRRKT